MSNDAFRAAMRGIASALPSAVQASLQDAGTTMLFKAATTSLWKDRTGKTRRAIRIGTATQSSVKVTATGVARFLEWGTRAHKITAKNGKSLRFVVGGFARFAKTVNHPGTSERPFMRVAQAAGAVALYQSLQAHVGRTVQGGK